MDDHIGKPINRVEFHATLQRWLPAAEEGEAAPPALDAGVFDQDVFDGIAPLLGPAKTRDTLQKFVLDLETRFAPADLSLEGRATFRRDAHVCTSVAGLLGFTELADCCGALLALPDGTAFELKAVEIIHAKERAMAKLMTLVGGASSGRAA